ncbi:MAG: type II toxin-antitoxin system RelB/DinJ family antitoxin [Oscillibacter sp.]|nr:type II toxin-antitoxin system RelB/DinJ family antitoxin [Oscillibacter sp.]
MAPVATSIKLDPKIKAESQALFERLGLSLSTAINLFLRQAIREQAIPFRIGEPMYNEETLRTIREARQGINLRGPYHSLEELTADLESEDTD